MVRVRVLVSGRVGVKVEGAVLICLSEPPRERVEISHVIIEYRVINHHPNFGRFTSKLVCRSILM